MAGGFNSVGGVPALRLARFDGFNVSSTGTAFYPQGSYFETLVGYDGSGPGIAPGLYGGGFFLWIGGTQVWNIARWDGSVWHALGTGFPATPLMLGVWDRDGPGPEGAHLYAGGGTTSQSSGLRRWDGASWDAPGGGIFGLGGGESSAHAMCEFDDDGAGSRPAALFVGGGFHYAGGHPAAGGIPARNLARWDGTAWEPVGAGTINPVGALAAFDEDGTGPGAPSLFVGTGGAVVGQPEARNLVRWDGTKFSEVAGYPLGFVGALVVHDDDGPGPRLPSLFVGGPFNVLQGGMEANAVARWDGRTWYPLESGLQGFGQGTHPRALHVFDEDGPGPNPGGLYVGGYFYYAGGVESHHVARWGCPLCAPDCDRNGALNLADFACFQTGFIAAEPRADCNTDGVLTVADFGCFQTRFVTGCP